MILAAIDLGSNAIRLLIMQVEGEGDNVLFTKLNLVRVPIRLGMDVFNGGMVSKERYEMLRNTMYAYQYFLHAYGVQDISAAASSAMRDATNGDKIRKQILKETKIDLRIISGSEEADILFGNKIMDGENSIFMDVGGGSTEITIKKNDKITSRQSFNIGTLRILNNHDMLSEWNAFEKFLVRHQHLNYNLVGTGGNINKTFSLMKIKEGKPIEISKLDKFYQSLAKLSVSQRMSKFAIREDRADVIVPALSIYLFAMKHLNKETIYVPKIGLADGLVKSLYFTKYARK